MDPGELESDGLERSNADHRNAQGTVDVFVSNDSADNLIAAEHDGGASDDGDGARGKDDDVSEFEGSCSSSLRPVGQRYRGKGRRDHSECSGYREGRGLMHCRVLSSLSFCYQTGDYYRVVSL